MTRPRLTRAQRKEQTREHLLEAAREMFVQKGLAATSVEDIAEAAGYTRGAFYSNFGGKCELLIELLRRDDDRARGNLHEIMEAGGTPGETKERAITYYSEQFLERECFPLWLEARLLACRDAAFQARFDAFRRETLGQVSAYIRMLTGRNGGPPALQADALAIGLVSLCDGVQLFSMGNPQMVSDKVIQSVLAGFLSCVLSRRPEDAVGSIAPVPD
ncbi:TetR/AcrR family transcriptional regulator [Paraburkholderia terrae]|uniref:TetR/AcrR family transcriptional regulator n=1 Tax=Paraburkholderia terrae TaxID=311230 RepID=UPI00296B0C11|nr:TetR/AcrR family transcriptional regulator [Paraburkholderia terrae]MDW3661894.1 TetR/AcrR family transcriptional regulator [Paraburkholderia terrae]